MLFESILRLAFAINERIVTILQELALGVHIRVDKHFAIQGNTYCSNRPGNVSDDSDFGHRTIEVQWVGFTDHIQS
ncbi:MAG: hypothetical protein ACOVQM_23330, partial [Pirellula sp.]